MKSLTVAGEVLGVLALICAVVLFGWYVWPTPYVMCDQGVVSANNVLPIDSRVHRVTGRVEALTIMGWVGPTKEEIAAEKAQRDLLAAAAAATRAQEARDTAAARLAQPGPGMAPSVPTPAE